MAATHTYRSSLTWSGSTGAGYDAYDRAHRLATPPAGADLVLSSDPAFGGDPALANPEQLLLAAASSCQLLSFLAVAARARLDVVAYADEASALMPEDDLPVRLTRIDLRPAVVLADTERARPDEERLLHLTEVAHRECFIANSLRTEVVVAPTFSWASRA
ncbi:OsmC family protein [Aquihabitans sp. G128]|uniref:OsmC family protein n=1 Tax=Aquihabitans sp. G128 TaxID=2849779 RepID=UPI0020B1B1C3|nr:OsmC family protein [Aquihabitans sp. G128]